MAKLGKNKRRIEEDDEDDWEEEAEDMETDEEMDPEDAELQEAFARGHLKPGLNAVFEERLPPANLKERLLQKLGVIRLDLPWIERMDVTTALAPMAPEMASEIGIDPNLVLTNKKNKTGAAKDVDVDELDNIDDDFKRELRFYRQAQGAVLEALPRLHALRIPTRRPEDYFAEMAKSDEHMKKIREKLITKQQQMELSEKAKKLREQKKYSKQVQQEVLKKRLEEKKKLAQSVQKFRKSGKGQQDEMDLMEDINSNSRQKGGRNDQKKPDKNGPPKKSGKQKYKDSKYGFGGQKKRSKYNTKDSADDVQGKHGKFDSRKHGNASAKGKKTQKRPGKAIRQKNKNKR
ncbi:hypothetical protein RvY_00914 [Ramazzottius varieornatus]|uniref:Uncharacterized protein n=1 Tax=Ramazzottius varieornatus TaxID=947166 RepID=A0A1D1UPT6_RAMVA|nr:hypothetical protein RvY_00914 [Ramazzottius varieornatus]